MLSLSYYPTPYAACKELFDEPWKQSVTMVGKDTVHSFSSRCVEMAGAAPSSTARGRRTKAWRPAPLHMVVLLVTIVVFWQVCVNITTLQSRLPLDSSRALHEFNATKLSDLQSQLEAVLNRLLGSPSNSSLGESQELLVTRVDRTLGMAQLALEKIEMLENQTLLIEKELENRMNSVQSATDAIAPSRRSPDTATVTLLEALAAKFLKMDDCLLKGVDAVKEDDATLKRQANILVKHIAESTPAWKPLKDLTKFSIHGFMSDIQGRGSKQGPPELFQFPSPLSDGRHLCYMGNDTSNGTRNFYTFARGDQDALPKHHLFLNGTTLIAETYWNYDNPWHSMFNTLQFVYWKQIHNACGNADRLLLYHWGELRRRMGDWISQVFTSAGLPNIPEQMEVGDRPVCFERAVVSRIGIGGVPARTLQKMYKEVRCLARKHCRVPVSRAGPSTTQSVHITLVVRSGGRAWKNQSAWEEVIAHECARVQGCHWGTMPVATMTFCQQVEIMSKTDILVSVHGAQLTNMIFMSPGGRVLEMFPKGWLENAGHGQYIYSRLANWTSLYHEGYWRDLDLPDCPFGADTVRCMNFVKDLPVGMNRTHVATWLHDVVTDFNIMHADMTRPPSQRKDPNLQLRWDSDNCTCAAKPKAR